MKIGTCGNVESNDCLITVKESSGITIHLESIVKEYFGKQIIKVIEDTLKELNITDVEVTCIDKGALDYTIRARLITAIERMNKNA